MLLDPAPLLGRPDRPWEGAQGGRGIQAGWREPPSAFFCPLGSANKAAFRDQFRGGWSIQRMRLSWRWGTERKPKMVRTGPGSGDTAKSPSPACGEDEAAGPIVSWALPPGPLPLLYNQCLCALVGCQCQFGGPWLGCRVPRACHSYLHNGTSLRIYFSLQFPNFDRQAWSSGLCLCQSRGSHGGVAGSRQGQASLKAVAY